MAALTCCGTLRFSGALPVRRPGPLGDADPARWVRGGSSRWAIVPRRGAVFPAPDAGQLANGANQLNLTAFTKGSQVSDFYPRLLWIQDFAVCCGVPGRNPRKVPGRRDPTKVALARALAVERRLMLTNKPA